MYISIILAIIVLVGFIFTARGIDVRYAWDIPVDGKDKFPKFKNSELYHNPKENIGCAFLAAGVVLVIGLFISTLATHLVVGFNLIKTRPVDSTEIAIYALEDNSQITGSSFLGSGYVNEKPAYYYIKKVDGKGLVTDYNYAEDSYINYVEGSEDPYLKEVEYGIAPGWKWILMPVKEYEYYFYIPEGSITNNYNVDLK
jgi:hypothetical protein